MCKVYFPLISHMLTYKWKLQVFPFNHSFFIYSALSLQIGSLITKVQVINTNVFESERRITASDFMSNKSCEPYDWSLTREKWIFIIWVTYKALKCQKRYFVLTYCEQKIVLVIEKNFWNLMLTTEKFQNFWDH